MNPKQTIEAALAAYFESGGVTVPIFKGTENASSVDAETGELGSLKVPCLTIACGDTTEAIPFTGNWEGEVSIKFEADAQGTKDADFRTASEAAFLPLQDSSFKEKLSSSLPDFTCLFYYVIGSTSSITQGGNWINEMRVHIVFCESDL